MMTATTPLPDAQAKKRTPLISVDDNPMMEDVIRMLMSTSSEFEHAGHFLSHQGVLEKVHQENIELLVLDYEIPGTDTLGLIRDIIKNCPACRVLMLSAHARSDIVEACRRAGASGYALKDQNPEAILEALRRVKRNKEPFVQFFANASRPSTLAQLGSLAQRGRELLQGNRHAEVRTHP